MRFYAYWLLVYFSFSRDVLLHAVLILTVRVMKLIGLIVIENMCSNLKIVIENICSNLKIVTENIFSNLKIVIENICSNSKIVIENICSNLKIVKLSKRYELFP